MEKFYINNTLLVNKLKQNGGKYNTDEEFEFTAFRTKAKKGVKSKAIKVSFWIERDDDVKPLTMMDFLILDAVYGIYKDAPKYRYTFTVRQLIHAITGTPEQPSSKGRTEKFDDEIEKLRRTRITINYKDEFEEKNIDGEYEPISMPLLPLEKISGDKKVGNNKYRITEKPPLYLYAEMNSQVISVPERMFYCDNIVGNTERNLLIKYNLLHELEVIRFLKTGVNKYQKKYDKDSIIYFEKADRRTESDSGFLTKLDWCLEEEAEERLKYEPHISDKFTTASGLHTISAISDVVIKLLDYYKKIGYLSDYELLRRTEKGVVNGVRITGKIEYPYGLK